MVEMGKRLFVGIKISKALQNELDSPAPGTEHYFKTDNVDYLQIINLGRKSLSAGMSRTDSPRPGSMTLAAMFAAS